MIDGHAHPFALTTSRFDPAEVSLDIAPGDEAATRRQQLGSGRVAVEMMQVRLANYLDCNVADLATARQDAAADWPAYVRGLFADVGITGMLLDPGAEHFPTPDGAQAWSALADIPMWEVLRIDPLVDRMLTEGAAAQEIVNAVEGALSTAAAQGAVAAKTVLAYRTGLAIRPDADIEAAKRTLHSNAPVYRRAKPLRDLLFRRILARCADLGLPLQVHTGFGDSDIRLAEANPVLLEEILRTPEGQHAQVVLLHGGFPWHEQAAYLAATRPNVGGLLAVQPGQPRHHLQPTAQTHRPGAHGAAADGQRWTRNTRNALVRRRHTPRCLEGCARQALGHGPSRVARQHRGRTVRRERQKAVPPVRRRRSYLTQGLVDHCRRAQWIGEFR